MERRFESEKIFDSYVEKIRDGEKKQYLNKYKNEILYDTSFYFDFILDEINEIRNKVNEEIKRDIKEFKISMINKNDKIYEIWQKWDWRKYPVFLNIIQETFVKNLDRYINDINSLKEYEEMEEYVEKLFEREIIKQESYNKLNKKIKGKLSILDKYAKEDLETYKDALKDNNTKALFSIKDRWTSSKYRGYIVPFENLYLEFNIKSENDQQKVNKDDDKQIKEIINNEKKQSPVNIVLLIFAVILAVAGIVLGYLFIIYLAVCSVTVFWQISHELKETNSSLRLKIARTILYFFAGPYNIIRYKRIYGTYNPLR